MDNIRAVKDLLYNYKRFKCILADKKQLLEEVAQYGLPDKSNSISSYPTTPISDSKEDIEENYINTLQHQIKSLERHTNAINNALDVIKDDKYYKIIEYRYFNKLSYNEIGELFYLDKSTVHRQDKRLIKELESCLFPNNATLLQPPCNK